MRNVKWMHSKSTNFSLCQQWLSTNISPCAFGFVTKDFIKPTAEWRQFSSGKSHHRKITLKSTLFGEALRLRCLNQKKITSTAQTDSRKSDPLKLFLRHNKWHASNGIKLGWLCPLKYDKKDDPQVWAMSFPPVNSIEEKIWRWCSPTRDLPQLGKN